jgi:two-component sensor histidine kinase
MKTQLDLMDSRYPWVMLAGMAAIALGTAAAFAFQGEIIRFAFYAILGMAGGMALAVVLALWFYRRAQDRLLAIVEPEALALATQLGVLARSFQPVANVEERLRRALHRERQTGTETSRTAFALLLHHRLKNSLQILASLLSLQIAREPQDACALVLRSVLLRLRVFGAVYRAAEAEDQEAVVDLDMILVEVVDHAKRIYHLPDEACAVNLDLHARAVSADAAIPLGLAVAEALIVIGNYGRTGDDRQCTIDLRADPARQRFVLTVKSPGLAAFLAENAETSSISRTFLASYATQLMGTLELSMPPAMPSLTLNGPISRSWN